jgi:hypothetical protein
MSYADDKRLVLTVPKEIFWALKKIALENETTVRQMIIDFVTAHQAKE